jgi:hypothetical protein
MILNENNLSDLRSVGNFSKTKDMRVNLMMYKLDVC